jgi:hypothetical protein
MTIEKTRQPWMKFYPADWRADPALRMCSFAARGLWVDMMTLMHEAEPYGHLLVSGRAPSARQLAALLGGNVKEIEGLIEELAEAGVFSKTDDGVVFSRRMTRDHIKAQADKANGRKGGNPRVKPGANPTVDGGDNPGVEDTVNPGLTGGVKAQKPEARSQKEDSAKSPLPVPRARDGIEDRTKSRPIIEAFDQALVEVYGEAHRRDWPQQADHVHAQRLVEQGWSPADCKAVFVKSLRQAKDLGRKPPGGIAFYEKRFAELTPGAVKPAPNPDAERIDDQHCRMLEAWADMPDHERRKTPKPTRDDAEKAVAERRKGAA